MIIKAIENSFLIDPLGQHEPSPNRHVVIGGWSDMASLEEISTAYKKAADEIVDRAIKSLEFAYEYTFPVIFLYRHALELNLKSICLGYKTNHSFQGLRDNFIRTLKGNISDSLIRKIQDRINDFIILDQKSTRFRYGVDNPQEEFIVDLLHLKMVIFEIFELVKSIREVKAYQNKRR